MRIPVLFRFLLTIASSLAFVTRQSQAARRISRSHLFGISEWRDMMSNYPGTQNNNNLGTESGPAPKEICILPFPYDEVLLQGETKQLRLYEDRFIQLFDHAMEHNCGVVAMGLIAESGIIQTVPICEIEAYNRMEGFGVFVTIRVVGRAQLMEITQQEIFLKAFCTEISDSIPPNLELPNLVASNIENFMLLLSSMEHRLEQAMDESEDEDSAAMKRRIQIAKLVRACQKLQITILMIEDLGTDVCTLLIWIFHSNSILFSIFRRIVFMMTWVMTKTKKIPNWTVEADFAKRTK
jgi:hypothetical protein